MTLTTEQRAAVQRRALQKQKRGMSKPLRVLVNLRTTPEERDRLHEMAEQCDVTLSWAMREGARLLLEDMAAKQNAAASG